MLTVDAAGVQSVGFKHYMYFVYEFNLIPKREELAPLQELIDKLLERDVNTQGRTTPTRSGGGSSDAGAAAGGASSAPKE